MKPANPYDVAYSVDRGKYCTVCKQATYRCACDPHTAWNEGYAAAQPTWTRVDLERPETFPLGWERHVSVEAPASPWPEEVVVWRPGMRRPQALSRVKHGDLWTPLPSPPKEDE